MSYPAKIRERFFDLRTQGWSFSRIAAELNVSRRTLLRWQGRYPVTISEREYFDCQEIIDRNHLSKRAKIEKFAVMIDRIDTTLTQRDLAREPIKDLMNLRNELREQLSALTRTYHIYAGKYSNPDPDEYQQGLIGVL